jgi:1-acyl-sn-glycerol-3-phosphate acyltransferase
VASWPTQERLAGHAFDPVPHPRGARLIPRTARRLEHLVRRLGTGFLFATFGLGALALASVILPASRWFRSSHEGADLAAQRLIHRSLDGYVRLGTALGLFRLRESGTGRLRAGAGLIVANHPTLLDVVFLLARIPQADCIVKHEAWRNPFLRPIVVSADYLPNHDGEALVEACAERLRAGRTVILFPEGSRSPQCGLRPFKRGAARVALASGCAITPVVVGCEPPALKKGQPWWRIPNRPLEFSLDVGEPFHATDVVEADLPAAIAARKLTAHLRTYFEARTVHERA